MNTDLATKVLYVRLAQLIINEDYRNGLFKIPIHLALGHEALAVALAAVLEAEDRLILTHRNIAYNLARSRSLRKIRDEYLLLPSGLAGGKLGSMNLAEPALGIPYASSILGNDFAVGTGVALALEQRGKGIAVALGGDGSIEEGAFYETLVLARSLSLPLMVIIENNEWSMATHVSERRKPINLARLVESIGIPYHALSGNDVDQYADILSRVRTEALEGPVVVEVAVHTLGDWVKQEEGDSRLINYHAGPAPTIRFDGGEAVITRTADDPVFLIEEKLGPSPFKAVVADQFRLLQKEIQ